jgi:hypothetical protein
MEKVYAFLIALEKFCADVSFGWFVLNGDHFQHQFCTIFLLPTSLMMAITASFPIPIAAHNSHVMMQKLFGIIASTLSLISTIAAMADESLFCLLPLFFPPLLN